MSDKLQATNGAESSFTLSIKNYLNGQSYFIIERGQLVIGSCVEHAEGWLVSGRRKPVPSLIHAAKQMIDSRINAAIAEQEKWRKAMRALSSELGPLV